MKRIAILIALAVVVLPTVSGCVHNRWREAEATAYYQAQEKVATAREPLFELRAQPGQTIQLTGVESLTVNDPREQRIAALPVEQSPFWPTLNNVLRIGAQVYGVKVAADATVDLVRAVGQSAGDHSVTTITDSYNSQGDTITDSQIIGGDVSGPGAGIGTNYTDGSVHVDGDGSVVGDGNQVINGDRNFNDGRQDSPGPIDDHGGDCREASDCSGPEPEPAPPGDG